MQKGIEFWSKKKVVNQTKFFFIVSYLTYAVSIYVEYAYLSFSIIIPVSTLLVLCLWMYRSMHSPLYNLEKSIKNIDEHLYTRMKKECDNLKLIKIGPAKKERLDNTALFMVLSKLRENEASPKIYLFVKNYRRFNMLCNTFITLWFITMLIYILKKSFE